MIAFTLSVRDALGQVMVVVEVRAQIAQRFSIRCGPGGLPPPKAKFGPVEVVAILYRFSVHSKPYLTVLRPQMFWNLAANSMRSRSCCDSRPKPERTKLR